MREITDDEVLEAVDRLIRDEELDDDLRDPVVLMVQRLIWPPSPHPWLHEPPHGGMTVHQRENGGWEGRLLCPHGCGRAWTVNRASTRQAVWDALTAAHAEYRTGRVTGVPMPSPAQRRMSLDALFDRSEYVEVTDRRLTGEES